MLKYWLSYQVTLWLKHAQIVYNEDYYRNQASLYFDIRFEDEYFDPEPSNFLLSTCVSLT